MPSLFIRNGEPEEKHFGGGVFSARSRGFGEKAIETAPVRESVRAGMSFASPSRRCARRHPPRPDRRGLPPFLSCRRWATCPSTEDVTKNFVRRMSRSFREWSTKRMRRGPPTLRERHWPHGVRRSLDPRPVPVAPAFLYPRPSILPALRRRP